jgi:curved DNA-binding protein CbpA
MFRRLERSGDFYGVLGVTRRASPDAIKQAYHSLARKFHPDRYRKEADHTLYLRIEGAFARFAQAYETLKDQKSRAVYDLKLEARPVRSQAAEKPETPKTEKATPQAREPIKPNSQAPGQPPTVAPTGKAELLFQSGMAALEQGKMNVAANYFGEAARTEPTNASYRGYYGKALAGFGSSQRQAEAEIQSAITLDPKNALFHVMLAELYLSLGFERRARVEFKKAIALDARLDDAREALARIDSNLRAQAQK